GRRRSGYPLRRRTVSESSSENGQTHEGRIRPPSGRIGQIGFRPHFVLPNPAKVRPPLAGSSSVARREMADSCSSASAEIPAWSSDIGDAQALEAVGVLELVEGGRMGSCHHWRHFLRGLLAAECGARARVGAQARSYSSLALASLDRRDNG